MLIFNGPVKSMPLNPTNPAIPSLALTANFAAVFAAFSTTNPNFAPLTFTPNSPDCPRFTPKNASNFVAAAWIVVTPFVSLLYTAKSPLTSTKFANARSTCPSNRLIASPLANFTCTLPPGVLSVSSIAWPVVFTATLNDPLNVRSGTPTKDAVPVPSNA